MSRALIACYLVVILSVANLSHAITFRDAGNGDLEAATTTTLALLHHGNIVRLVNLASKENLSSNSSMSGNAATYLMNQTGELDAPSTDTVSTIEIQSRQAIQRTRFISGSSIETVVTTDPSGGLQFRQEVSSKNKGLESMGLGIGPLASGIKVLIPTGTGLALDERFTGTRDFQWPNDWRVQLFFLQGRSGGVLIRAADPTFSQFKTLRVQHESTSATLSLGLITPVTQPVTEINKSTSVTWSIRGVAKDWRAIAEEQRKDILPPRYDLITQLHARRAWMDSIRLIVTPSRMRQKVTGPIDIARHKEFIDTLRRRVSPETVLLNYAYDWRKEERDTGQPGQEINPAAAQAINYARQQGFRIMLSFDIRCDLRHPIYPQVRRAHMHFGMPQSPPFGYLIPPLGAEYVTFVQRPLWKLRAGIPETQLAVINPALKGWRDLVVSYLANTLGQLQTDTVQLIGFTYANDANGLIDGKNSIQGYRQMIADLRDGLPPSMALSVDAWDQISAGYCDFAQLQLPKQLEVSAARPQTMRFDDSLLPFIHPITAVLLRRDITPYAATELTTPDFEQANAAWDFSTVCLAPLPHVSDVDENTLHNPSPVLARYCNEDKALQSIGAAIDPGAWQDNAQQCAWAGKNGRSIQFISEDGKTMQMMNENEKERPIFQTDLQGHYETEAAASMPSSMTARK